MKISNINASLVFFILIVIGRYLGNSVLCATRNVLNKELSLRLIILFLLITATLSLKTDKISSITNHFTTAFIVFCSALMFTKLDPYFMTIILALLASSQIMNRSDQLEDPKKNIFGMTKNSKDMIINIFDTSAFIILIFGFALSYFEAIKDPNFSYEYFLFSGHRCRAKIYKN